MLGASCSPCCSPTTCSRAVFEPIYDEIRSKAISVSISGVFDVAGAYASFDGPGLIHWLDGREPTASSFSGVRAGDAVIGSHDLPLSLDPSETLINNGTFVITFKKTTETLDVVLSFSVGGANSFLYADGSPCRIRCSFYAVTRSVLESATWSQVKPALSVQRQTATDVVSLDSVRGCAPNTYNWAVNYISPPVFAMSPTSTSLNIPYFNRNFCADADQVSSVLFRPGFGSIWDFGGALWESSLSDLVGSDVRNGIVQSTGFVGFAGNPLPIKPSGQFWKSDNAFQVPAVPVFTPTGAYSGGFSLRWDTNPNPSSQSNLSVSVSRSAVFGVTDTSGGLARFNASGTQAARNLVGRRTPSISSIQVVF